MGPPMGMILLSWWTGLWHHHGSRNIP
jgi:hypothetical protein